MDQVREAATDNGLVDVIVVGGGVSGCACAAALAGGGAQVVVLSSALDVVGLPGYGPVVESECGGWEEIEQVFSALQPSLRSAWLSTAAVPASGQAAVVVDRRAVSIETKRLLEFLPGLQFRQGLVTDIRPVSSGQSVEPSAIPYSTGLKCGDETVWAVEVETAFGEIVRGRTVVLALGLGLGGTIAIGEEVVSGGRYGEVPANELQEALARHGVGFRSAEVEVGPRYAGGGTVVRGACAEADRCGRRVRLVDVHGPEGGPTASEPSGQASDKQASREGGLQNDARVGPPFSSRLSSDGVWPEGYPPAPHWSEGSVCRTMVLAGTCWHTTSGDQGHGGTGGSAVDDACAQRAFVPDGKATGEFYVCKVARGPGTTVGDGQGLLRTDDAHIGMMVRPLSAAQISSFGQALPDQSWELQEPASRLGYLVRASVVTGLDAESRIPGLGSRVWVAGRATGAKNYVESLRSATTVAESVLLTLKTVAHCEGVVS